MHIGDNFPTIIPEGVSRRLGPAEEVIPASKEETSWTILF
jgi:hypothetical protein